MPHRSYQSAIGQGIAQAVLRADFMDYIQDFLLCCPNLLNLALYLIHNYCFFPSFRYLEASLKKLATMVTMIIPMGNAAMIDTD